ncbi:MAG: M12 family metallo-peptidase [Cystobacterineae bacterium]|nr:M12 family metallo-peptidase [Cystobacterineae bacterium]
MLLALAMTFSACGDNNDNKKNNNNNIVNNDDHKNNNGNNNGNNNSNTEESELFMPLAMGLSNSPVPADDYKDATPAQWEQIEKIKKRQTTASVSLTRVDINAFKTDNILISLSSHKKLLFSKKHFEAKDANNFTWSGSISGGSSTSTFVVRDGNTAGSIRDGNNELYRIEPIGESVHALVKIDESKFPPCAEPLHDDTYGTQNDAPSASVGTLDVATAANPAEIDVLVAFTPAARRAAYIDMALLIQQAVEETNESYQNSSIHIRLSLVDSLEVNYSEVGKDYNTILKEFANMQEVKDRRDASGADMAVLIIDQWDYCGVATSIRANADNAFALVHYDCATGYYSFAHELGHLQGARHDERTDPTTSPFAYGHGYIHPSTIPPQNFRTVMAYDCPSFYCPRIAYWSNPDISYNGMTIGTAHLNNNARVLNETAQSVAGFRPKYTNVAAGASQLNTGERLSPGQSLVSLNGQYQLLMEADGNLVLSTVPGNQPLWASATGGNPGAYAQMHYNGDFVVYSVAGKVLWATGTNEFWATSVHGVTANVALQDDGSWGVYANAEQLIWRNRTPFSLTGPVAILQSGQSLAFGKTILSMNADGNLVLDGANNNDCVVPWTNSGTGGNPGAYMVLSGDGIAIYNAAGDQLLWHSTSQIGPTKNVTALQLRSEGRFVLYGNNMDDTWWFPCSAK